MRAGQPALLAFLTLGCSQLSAMAIMLHESPYFVPGVSNVSYEYTEDTFGGRAFRVMGIPKDTPLVPLNWYQAEQACADVGMGLAAVANTARKDALDAALLAAEVGLPAAEAPEPYVWIGGYRTSLSDPLCIGPGVPVDVYPYFVEYQDGTYRGCGKHEYHDWAWARPSADGSFDDADKEFILWRQNRGPEEYWDKYERTGLDKNDPQPTGWNGAFNLEGWPNGGDYENCTAAQVFTADNPDVNAAARGRAYYDDYGCYGSQTRWVCEFEDPDQAVDAAALAARSPEATVTTSPFFIPGVTSEVRTVNDDTHYRVFGITPERAALIKSDAPGISWVDALKACGDAGGTNLATNPESAYSAERYALMGVVSSALFEMYNEASFSVWLGGATTVAANTTGATLAHEDFSWFGSEGTEQLNPGHRQWTVPGWPKGGPDYVGPAEGDAAVTSCMASVWDAVAGTEGTWQNFLCNDPGVKYFMCQFPSAETGIVTDLVVGTKDPDATPSSTPSSPEDVAGLDDGKDDEGTNTGAIVGGALGGALALLVLAIVGAVFVRKRRNSKRDATNYSPSTGAALPVTFNDADGKPPLSAAGSGGAGAALMYPATTGSNPLRVQLSGDQDMVMVPSRHETTVSADTPATHRGCPGSAGGPGGAGVPPALFAMSSAPTSSTTRMHGFEETQNSYAWVDTVSHVTVPSFVAGSTMGAAGYTHAGATTAGTTTETPLARLNRQLDSLISAGGVFAKKYVLADSADRREGGQGVVQFARGRFNGFEYAIKFFVSSRAYATERELYQLPLLHRILPNIEDLADESQPEMDHLGQPLPPYIVMERGEALDEWSRRANPDMPTSVTVLSHLANRLAELHAAGMCHRDLKPANVMWLPRENRWTIIDFGCVANIGTEAPLAYSAAYAAPEVIAAVDALQAGRGTHMMVVTPALDAWSVGVMAFEMLTSDPTENKRKHKISVEQLRGEQPLPWEGEKLTKDVKRRLGVLKKPILQLLSRDPAARPSMASLKAQCDEIFTGKTTVESTTSVDSA